MYRFAAEQNVLRFEAMLREAGTPAERVRLEALLAEARAELEALTAASGPAEGGEDA